MRVETGEPDKLLILSNRLIGEGQEAEVCRQCGGQRKRQMLVQTETGGSQVGPSRFRPGHDGRVGPDRVGRIIVLNMWVEEMGRWGPRGHGENFFCFVYLNFFKKNLVCL